MITLFTRLSLFQSIAENLSKQQELNVDLKEIQKTNFTGNLARD